MNPNAIVLRGLSTIGITEIASRMNALSVHPTTGRHFRIDVAHPERIRSMGICSLTGELVEQLTQRTWNAGSIAAAPYLVTVVWLDGTTTSQRIDVMD